MQNLRFEGTMDYMGGTILHLSDLHFGAVNQADVFRQITPKLSEIRPNLVLVTGDLVDSPKINAYRDALTSIRGACPDAKVFCCPGNHDRFRRGNRWYLWSQKPSPLFKEELGGSVLSSSQVHVEPVAGWKIGLLEIDSSHDADYFARGLVRQDEIDSAVNATKGAECDLCIALTHHHPLPVRALEAHRSNRLRDLAQVTALVNAGTLLEALANANIDLVLHGHEHAANWARYGSFERGRGEIAILGAGSGTGNDSINGCALANVSFNVIVLDEDRTVRVKVVSYRGGWVEQRLSLLEAAPLRRRRLLRKLARVGGDLQDDLGTEITKSVRFTSERDIIVDWEFTNWKFTDLDSQLNCGYPIKNATGIPVDSSVTLINDLGQDTRTVSILQTQEPFKWLLRWTVPASYAPPNTCTQKMSYTWRSGALLEISDFEAYQGTQLGLLRSEGYEYASIKSYHNMVSRATLVVRIPRWAAPPSVEVRVFDAQYGRHNEEETELARRVRSLGAGHFVLSVPYPRTEWLYALAWRPQQTRRSSSQEQFATEARRNGIEMLTQFRESLGTEAASCDLTLYVPEGHRLVVAAQIGPSTTVMAPANFVLMRGDQHLLAQAWWGGFVEVRDTGDPQIYQVGVIPGESIVWGVPIRRPLDPPAVILGVVRAAVRGRMPNFSTFAFSRAVAALLTAV